jgi:hypothetical protein
MSSPLSNTVNPEEMSYQLLDQMILLYNGDPKGYKDCLEVVESILTASEWAPWKRYVLISTLHGAFLDGDYVLALSRLREVTDLVPNLHSSFIATLRPTHP